MTDEIMHTVVPSANGWGGALGAGVGGLIGSWFSAVFQKVKKSGSVVKIR